MPNIQDSARERLNKHFSKDCYDYERSYVRRVMKEHPEITDKFIIANAADAMWSSHEGGVELSVDDALRFTANEKPLPLEEVMRQLAELGANDSNFIDKAMSVELDDGKIGSVKNEIAKRKAEKMMSYADMLDGNEDIMLLNVPIFNPFSDYTQLKIAFFSENLTGGEKQIIAMLTGLADRTMMKVEHGVAVTTLQLFNIWKDFK
jgi:hypothetical protein